MDRDVEVIGADSPIQRIFFKGECQALIVRESLPKQGYNFVSQDADTLQIGVNHYPAGGKARPHYHPPLERTISVTAEVLHIDSGSCKLFLFETDQHKIYETQLVGGDTVILLAGGHSLDFLEPTKIIEVKQGPYYGAERDKIFFESK